jgi:hypothetical protein
MAYLALLVSPISCLLLCYKHSWSINAKKGHQGLELAVAYRSHMLKIAWQREKIEAGFRENAIHTACEM